MKQPGPRPEPLSRSAPARLEPVGQMPPQVWMTAPATRAVIEALSRDGADVRFIGGCVRDAILKRSVRDIDIAVPMPPEAVMALLRRAEIKVVPTGIDHGTVTAVVDKVAFEITSLRVDVESDGRRAKVAFTDDWQADAARRDFTINALSCSPDGDIYDYFGGLDDLGRGHIRFVGTPRARIAEDRLRLLRFFRFFAHYGRPPADAAALAACRAEARGVSLLSGERVRVETFRTLMASDPADVFLLMQDTGVLEHVLPEADRIDRLRMMTWLDSRAIRFETIEADPIRRLAALITTSGDGARTVAARLKMSNAHRDRLVAMMQPACAVTPEAGAPGARRALYRLGAAAVRDLVLLSWADEGATQPRRSRTRTAAWIAILEAADTWTPIEFPLKGRDALALGVPPGPRVGELMKAIEAWWEHEDYRPDREACLSRLQRMAGEPGDAQGGAQESAPGSAHGGKHGGESR